MSSEEFSVLTDSFSCSGSEEEVRNPLEEQYYEAKDLKIYGSHVAFGKFQDLLLETNSNHLVKDEYYFKILKQLVKLSFKLSRDEEAFNYFKQLLECVSKPTRGISFAHIDSTIQKFTDLAKSSTKYIEFIEASYNLVDSSQNQNVWAKLSFAAAEHYLKLEHYEKLEKVLDAIYKHCLTPDGKEDIARKGTRLKQLFALKIQMHTQKNELSFLRKLFEKCEKIDSAIPSPSVIGVIYECGGRLAMKDSRYQDAKAYFYKAFQAFDQSADYRRKSCLIYYVLAVMLDKKRVEETSINPFTSEETQIYKSDSEVRPFYDLFEAFNSLNLFQFNKVFHENEEYFYKDELVKNYINELQETTQMQVIKKLVLPYKTIKIEFIAKKLNISVKHCFSIIILMILNKDLNALVDESNGVLHRNTTEEDDFTSSLLAWCENIEKKLKPSA